jgi:hypothetical protein
MALVSHGQEQSKLAWGEIEQLLLEMKDHRSTSQLAALFRIGDDQIADLIRKLRDPNKQVKLNAQIVIRYLGNKEGMDAWVKSYEFSREGPMTGPIPIPLSDLDYEFIRGLYLRDNITTEPLMEAYLFALALDNSPRAAQYLSDVISNAQKHGFRLDKSRYDRVRTASIGNGDNLANGVLLQSTFLDPAERKYATSRLLAYSSANDKALIEIYIDRGPLAQEWYHVVMRRYKNNWKFFSVTQVAVS